MELAALVVTRGKDGMSLFNASSGSLHRVDIPTMARSVYDVTGAGDTSISVLAATIAAGGGLSLGVNLANLAAGIKVAKRGTGTVTIAEIHQRLSEGENIFTETNQRPSNITAVVPFCPQVIPRFLPQIATGVETFLFV
jgi:D-beta-D-heptose 7-phosphate kinase/D-beta-D-heptose 1-phosphate adenosyltransferase